MQQRINRPPDEVHVREFNTLQVSEVPSNGDDTTVSLLPRERRPHNHTTLLATLNVGHADTSQQTRNRLAVTAGHVEKSVEGDIVARRMEYKAVEARWHASHKPPSDD